MNLKSLIYEAKCFKLQNPSMIDLILTNYRNSFMKTPVMETGISGHHKTIFSILKHTFVKALPRTISYRDLETLIKKRSIVTWNPKGQRVRIPLKRFWKSFKKLYNYLLL